METTTVRVYVKQHYGRDIMYAAQQAQDAGCPYFLFNGYLVPSAEVPDDYQQDCPEIGFDYLTDLVRYREVKEEKAALKVLRGR